jgi:two-component sensor histidine kinase
MDDRTQSPPDDRKRQTGSPLIVGVGASTAAMSSIERFFSRLSVDHDQTIVLVLQFRDAIDGTRLREALCRPDENGVIEIRDGLEVTGGVIHVCPSNMITTIQGDRFAVRPAAQAGGERTTIDSLLVSLAEQRAEASIGVVLAGTGGDGTLGVASLKGHGGLVLVERAPLAVYADKAEAGNTAASIAEFVLAAEDIPERIYGYARRLRRLQTGHVERLETELSATRERLQATIEELESTNAELKSSNEEYQSLNGGLRSANAALETSREELRSVNEKLTTVNGELAHRVRELTRATSDLKNFLESTQIATVFLDNDLRVMNFTPAITQMLPLVETDVGRPIEQIKARIPIEELYDDVRRVLRTLVSAERKLTAPDSGTHYIIRVLPYRSIENFVAGVVITFVDVTAMIRAEERQRLLLAELQHRVRNTLGVVRSIARRSSETSTTVEEYASHLDGRLNAFARTQAMVTRDPEGGIDLEYLVVEELLSYNAREGEQLRISGPTVRFQSKAAETFALAVHELATNAIKYGALSQPTGRVDVTWRVDIGSDLPQLVFEWRERGGPSVKPPQRKGFGSELLERTLAFELKGRTTLTYDTSGIHCTITVPLNRRIVHTPIVDV